MNVELFMLETVGNHHFPSISNWLFGVLGVYPPDNYHDWLEKPDHE